MELQFSKPVPFEISVPQEDVDAFEASLLSVDLARFQKSIYHPESSPVKVTAEGRVEGELDFTYGLPAALHPVLLEAAKKFSWRDWQARLNSMGEHGKVTVSGPAIKAESMTVHYVRQKARQGPARAAVLLVHGWPGSFLEFKDLAPLLTEAGYDVVVPSLPGYAFSSPPKSSSPPQAGTL
jgi:hypothetical protein